MGAIAQGAAHGQSRVHRTTLPKGAVTHDWAAMLAVATSAVSTETMLKPEPSARWRCGIRQSTVYASPAVAGDCLVFLHRLGDRGEIVEFLHPETAASQWQFDMGPRVRRTGTEYNNGPRFESGHRGERCFTVGAEAKLHCLGLDRGRFILETDLRTDTRFRRISSAPHRHRWLRTVIDCQRRAPGGRASVGLDKATVGAKYGAPARVGSKLCITGPGHGVRKNGGCSCLRRRVENRQRVG